VENGGDTVLSCNNISYRHCQRLNNGQELRLCSSGVCLMFFISSVRQFCLKLTISKRRDNNATLPPTVNYKASSNFPAALSAF